MKGFDYEEYKDQKIQKALKEKMEQKIFKQKEKAKVNEHLLHSQKVKNPDAFNDPRFGKMFTDKNFEMNPDEKS